jgi:mannose-1-phosphate guanylyltransferase
VAIVPADQRVGGETEFRTALAGAGRAAAEGAIALLAVAPREPSTRYGWVECEDPSTASERLLVRRFVEKPDRDAAERFAVSGRHYLNAGIFVWRADVFWSALERYAPAVAAPVAAFVDSGKTADWERATKTSIDYALLERLPDLVAVTMKAEWNDVGSWDAVVPLVEAGDAGPARLVPSAGNAPDGSVVIAIGDPRPRRAVLLGGQALLIVHGPGGVLVAPRSEADGVKSFGG